MEEKFVPLLAAGKSAMEVFKSMIDPEADWDLKTVKLTAELHADWLEHAIAKAENRDPPS